MESAAPQYHCVTPEFTYCFKNGSPHFVVFVILAIINHKLFKMKKILLLYSFLIFACSGGGDSDDGSEDIIGDNFIVSAEFAELFNNIGGQSTVGNNQILKKDAESIMELDLSDPVGGSNIGYLDDLSGIENFTNLRRLTIDRQSLRNIDLSKNKKLEYIHIWNNKLISINLDGLENLETLELNGNKLESINLSDSPYITHLRLAQNFFSSYDLSSTPRVDYLVLKSNPLTQLSNLNDLTLLRFLYMESTDLSSLDVSQLPSLQVVEAPNTNLLNCIQVSQNQLDNFVSTWINDEGDVFLLNCD